MGSPCWNRAVRSLQNENGRTATTPRNGMPKSRKRECHRGRCRFLVGSTLLPGIWSTFVMGTVKGDCCATRGIRCQWTGMCVPPPRLHAVFSVPSQPAMCHGWDVLQAWALLFVLGMSTAIVGYAVDRSVVKMHE